MVLLRQRTCLPFCINCAPFKKKHCPNILNFYRGATPFDKRYFALSGLFVGGPWIKIHGYKIGRPYRNARKRLSLLPLFSLGKT